MGGATVASRTGYETPGPTIKWAFYLKVRILDDEELVTT